MTSGELNNIIGNIDLYLLDQILKGRITSDMRILDAGCGEGRNLHYFLNNGFKHVIGIDPNPAAIQMLQMTARQVPKEHFIVSSIENVIFPPSSFDYIICNAVLHFAEGHSHFQEMLEKLASLLKPGAQLFIRMTSTHGMDQAKELEEGVYQIPDGSTRYLLDIDNIPSLLSANQLTFVEPLKSVHVHNHRSMTTLILRKSDN